MTRTNGRIATFGLCLAVAITSAFAPVIAAGIASAVVLAGLRLKSSYYVAAIALVLPLGNFLYVSLGSGGFVISWADLAILLAVVVLAARHQLAGGKYILPLVALLIWNVASTLFARDVALSLSGLKTLALASLGLLSAVSLSRWPSHRNIVLSSIAVAGVVLGASVLWVVARSPYGFADAILRKDEIETGLGGSNYLAAVLALCIAGTFVRIAETTNGRIRIAHFCAAIFQSLGVIATGSRSQIATLAVAWILGYILLVRQKRIGRGSSGLFFGIAGLVFLLYEFRTAIGAIWAPIADSGVAGYSSFQSREAIWASVWEIIANNPVFGVGLQNLTGPAGESVMAHNWLLQVWGETGLVGLALYIGVFVSLFLMSRGAERKSFVYIVAVAIVSGMLEPTIRTREYDYLLWLLLGLLVSSQVGSNQEIRKGELVG